MKYFCLVLNAPKEPCITKVISFLSPVPVSLKKINTIKRIQTKISINKQLQNVNSFGTKDECLRLPYSPADRGAPRELPYLQEPAGNVVGKSVPVGAPCLFLALGTFLYNNKYVHVLNIETSLQIYDSKYLGMAIGSGEQTPPDFPRG